MNIDKILEVLDPEVVQRLKTAVEIGKWPNGVALTEQQREVCLQAVLAWEYTHLPAEERTGYIDKGHKTEGDACEDDALTYITQPIRFT